MCFLLHTLENVFVLVILQYNKQVQILKLEVFSDFRPVIGRAQTRISWLASLEVCHAYLAQFILRFVKFQGAAAVASPVFHRTVISIGRTLAERTALFYICEELYRRFFLLWPPSDLS